MRPEPTRTIHVALTCGYFVKEPDETAWIITGVPGILHAQLVSLKLESRLTPRSSKLRTDPRPQKPYCKCVVSTNARNAAVKIIAVI